MNITGSYPKSMPIDTGRTCQPRQYGPVPPSKSDLARRFDSISIGSGRGSIELELRGKLSQEVRTATSSGLVSALREQIASGAYEPDAGAIAQRILLMGEGA